MPGFMPCLQMHTEGRRQGQMSERSSQQLPDSLQREFTEKQSDLPSLSLPFPFLPSRVLAFSNSNT